MFHYCSQILFTFSRNKEAVNSTSLCRKLWKICPVWSTITRRYVYTDIGINAGNLSNQLLEVLTYFTVHEIQCYIKSSNYSFWNKFRKESHVVLLGEKLKRKPLTKLTETPNPNFWELKGFLQLQNPWGHFHQYWDDFTNFQNNIPHFQKMQPLS